VPMRRLVVALAVLLVGVLGVGVVTAVNRGGDHAAKPDAQPSPTGPVFSPGATTEPPLVTETPAPEPTVTPTVAPTATPAGSGANGGNGSAGNGGGGGDKPDMPNTGGSPALAALALASSAAGAGALGVRRAVRH
jgi:hypothetical protein